MRTHACVAIISGNNEIEEQASVQGWWKEDEKQGYLKILQI